MFYTDTTRWRPLSWPITIAIALTLLVLAPSDVEATKRLERIASLSFGDEPEVTFFDGAREEGAYAITPSLWQVVRTLASKDDQGQLSLESLASPAILNAAGEIEYVSSPVSESALQSAWDTSTWRYSPTTVEPANGKTELSLPESPLKRQLPNGVLRHLGETGATVVTSQTYGIEVFTPGSAISEVLSERNTRVPEFYSQGRVLETARIAANEIETEEDENGALIIKSRVSVWALDGRPLWQEAWSLDRVFNISFFDGGRSLLVWYPHKSRPGSRLKRISLTSPGVEVVEDNALTGLIARSADARERGLVGWEYTAFDSGLRSQRQHRSESCG